MKKIILIFVLFLVAAGGVILYLKWDRVQQAIEKLQPLDEEEAAEDLRQAQEYIDQDQAEEAMPLIRRYDAYITDQTEFGRQWMNVLIQASEQLGNSDQLLILYDYYPETFKNHEEASALVSSRLIQKGRMEDFQTLRDEWKGKETLEAKWFQVDADNLQNKGDRRALVEFLQLKEFEGKDDVPRLSRLAFAIAQDDPKAAWNYLSEALKKDPNDPNIHLMRARLLEALGKQQLALSEMVAAAQSDPDNLFLRDQVAEYFRRYRQYKQALNIWDDVLEQPNTDSLWLKTWFWSRVITPIAFPWEDKTPPDGSLKPLLEYLIDLPENEFWVEDDFQNIPNANAYLIRLQQTFWLRLLQMIKDERYLTAMDLLESNPFNRRSWNPELEEALARVIQYRLTGSLVLPSSNPINRVDDSRFSAYQEIPSSVNLEPQFFERLRSLAEESMKDPQNFQLPPDVKALLDSKEAFASVILGAGWLEAGLDLHQFEQVPADFPTWVSYAVTMAIKENRGSMEALDFASRQVPTPQLTLLSAELLIDIGDKDAAIDKIETIIDTKGAIGIRAAWLKSLIQLEKEQFAQAKSTVESHKELSESTLGKETLARIWLLQGDEKKAEEIYINIEEDSPEAKSYLARKAYQQKNWKKARQLTEELLIEFPNNIVLRKNLQKIISENPDSKPDSNPDMQ